MRVLIVEDDSAARQYLRFVLEDAGYSVLEAADGRQGLALAGDCDLAITDLLMPGQDGFSFCRALRARSSAPIIAVSGNRATLADRVQILQSGADAFLPKPFDHLELLAHVESLARRVRPPATQMEPALLRSGRLALDLIRNQASVHGGTAISLTPTECRLLARLARQPGRAVSRRALEEALWGRLQPRSGGTLASYIAALRRKLEPEPRQPRLLLTVRGVGYQLTSA